MLPEEELKLDVEGIDADYYYYDEDSCPVCGGYTLIKEGRCTYCNECGWSKCDI